MDAEYYSLFSDDLALVESMIEKSLFIPGSEFFPTRFIRRAGVLAGFITWFNAVEIFPRRILVLKTLLAATSDPRTVKKKLQNFEGADRSVPHDSLYLSKIYVDSNLRGLGIASRIFERFILEGAAQKNGLSLHVRRDNIEAIALYKKYGFSFTQKADLSESLYYLMIKN